MGTAIVSINMATGSLHANILFRGLLKEGDTRVPFTVRFRTRQGTETRIVEESVLLDSPAAVSSFSRSWFIAASSKRRGIRSRAGLLR